MRSRRPCQRKRNRLDLGVDARPHADGRLLDAEGCDEPVRVPLLRPLHLVVPGTLSPRFGLSISWSGKRNFVGRDWRAISAAECGRTAGIRFADRDTPH